MSDKAILVRGEIVPADLMTWAKWFENNPDERIVGKTVLGDARVSTVFLGMDHSFGSGKKLWFETMIFGGPHDEFQERYETLGEAKAGHEAAVRLVMEGK